MSTSKFFSFLPAVLLWISYHSDCAAGAYAFAGLNINNFVMLKQDSGVRIRESDFDRGNSGRSDTGVFEIALDKTSYGGGGPKQWCLGNCSLSENDFTRPALAPADPSNGLHYVRTDELRLSDILQDSNDAAYSNSVVAEIDLSKTPERNSIGRYRRWTQLSVVPEFTDEVVFEFDADIALRAVSDAKAPNTRLTASSEFTIKLESARPVRELLFEFTPNGLGTAQTGGTVVADPVSLNAIISAAVPLPRIDAQSVGSGHFRVISPIVTAGTLYFLTVEQEMIVTATVVPEPSFPLIASSGLLSLLSIRRR